MKKWFLSIAVVALAVGTSFAQVVYDIDSTNYLNLEDLRGQTFIPAAGGTGDYNNFNINSIIVFNDTTTDFSLTAPLTMAFPFTPGDYQVSGRITLASTVEDAEENLLPVTISPAVDGISFLSGVNPYAYPGPPEENRRQTLLAVAAGNTFIFKNFTSSVINVKDSVMGQFFNVGETEGVFQGTMIFEDNTNFLTGGAVLRAGNWTMFDRGIYEFTDNHASWGGAIYVDGSMRFAGGVYNLTGNWAVGGGNDAGKSGHGGAIYAGSPCLRADGGNNPYTANWNFIDNMAAGLGGAIYASGGIEVQAGCAFNSPTGAHTVTFQGNRDGVVFTTEEDVLVPDYTNSKANAIHQGNAAGVINLRAGDAMDSVVLYDPITMEQGKGKETNLSKVHFFINGDGNNGFHRGIITFDGSYWNNLVGYTATADDITSHVYGTLQVTSGWLKIANGAVINVEQAYTQDDDGAFVTAFGGNVRAGGFIPITGSNDLGAAGSVFIDTGAKLIVEETFYTARAASDPVGATLWIGVDDTSAGLLQASQMDLWNNELYIDLSKVSFGTQHGTWHIIDILDGLDENLTIRVSFDGVDWVRYTNLRMHDQKFDISMFNLEALENGFIWSPLRNAWICTQEDLDRTWSLSLDGVLTVVPEPATWVLLSLGLGAAVFLRRRKK